MTKVGQAQDRAGRSKSHLNEKRLHTTRVRHPCDTRRAVLRVACCVTVECLCVLYVVVPQVC